MVHNCRVWATQNTDREIVTQIIFNSEVVTIVGTVTVVVVVDVVASDDK